LVQPDAVPRAGFKAERQQPRCERIDPPLKLAVSPPDLLVAHDQRIALGETLGDAVETDADRLADQGRRARAMNITRLRHSSTSPRNYFAAPAPGCSVVKLADGCSAAITSTRSSQPDHSPVSRSRQVKLIQLRGASPAAANTATWKPSPLSIVGVSSIPIQPSRPQCTIAGSGRAIA